MINHQQNSRQNSPSVHVLHEISLKRNYWDKSRKNGFDLYFTGYLWYGDELVLSADSLLKLLFGHCTAGGDPAERMRNTLLPEANGNFAIILRNETGIFAATDIIRSYPLYIVETPGGRYITDSIFGEKEQFTPDYGSMEEFIATQYTFGHQTVYKEITSVEPGETIRISNSGEVKRNSYFRFIYDLTTVNETSDKTLHKRLDDLLLAVFQRMIDSAPASTQWVIPLSGGIDSRLIANYLYRLGCKNVVCYSYGVPDYEQSRISKEVAHKLGYRWEFVEYTEQKWMDLHRSGAIDSFINYAFNGDSLPHLQDFLAVHELREKGVINGNSIIVPGHQMGFITDFVESDRPENDSAEALLNTLLEKNVKIGNPGKRPESLRNRFLKQIEESDVPHASFSEYFSWANRHTKFTAHSVRAYEFFGCSWRLPYWEKELVDFWLAIDLPRRSNQKLYKEAAESTLLVKPLAGIPYAKRPHESLKNSVPNILRQTLKNLIPDPLLVSLNRLLYSKKHLNEGLTQIYALRAKDIKDLVGPIGKWPEPLRLYLAPLMRRYTTQVNYHVLTAIYTLYRKVVSKR